jgi:hypothetical protein
MPFPKYVLDVGADPRLASEQLLLKGGWSQRVGCVLNWCDQVTKPKNQSASPSRGWNPVKSKYPGYISVIYEAVAIAIEKGAVTPEKLPAFSMMHAARVELLLIPEKLIPQCLSQLMLARRVAMCIEES